jgi:TPR repeat protein
MAEPEAFLFVSHVTEDRAAALKIVDELERRGIPCWIAPRNIEPGKPFDDEIAAALDRCRAMLLVFSDQCNESEYIRREVTVAGESHKVIIPFRIEDAQPRRGLRVRLSDLHWLDGFVAHERAIEELARRFGPGAGATVSADAVPPPDGSYPDGSYTMPDSAPDAVGRAAAATEPPVRSASTERWIASVGASAMAIVLMAAAAWFWSSYFGTIPPAPTPPAPTPPAPTAPASAPLAGHSPPQPSPAPPPVAPAAASSEALSNGKAAFDRKDYTAALRWSREAADQGNATAQTLVGYLYEKGLGVPPHGEEALNWYRKAAQQGYAPAQRNLGNLYEQGAGVRQDYAEALRWYRLAAEQGNGGAQTNAGYLYEKGLGVPRDYAEALRWYRKAAEQGEANAQNNIGVFYDKGYGVAQDYGEALRWYRLAAEQGNIDAQYNLALLYAEGHGVSRDLDQARQWMQKAAAAGDPEARKWLDANPG